MTPTKDQIRSAREAACLTTAEAAKLAAVSQRMWQFYERGDRNISPAAWELFTLRVELAGKSEH